MARHARHRSLGITLIRSASVVLIGCAALMGGWLGWFYWHSSTGGSRLLGSARQQINSSPGAGACENKKTIGELVAPRIGLVAPVAQGDSDAVLSDAVGHVPASSWPGGSGTTVLVGHDVTWFHDILRLKAGNEVEYLDACHALIYEVRSARVVTAGAAITNDPGMLALVTCWPLNALWFTGKRLVVEATLVGGVSHARAVRVRSDLTAPTIPVPSDLIGVDSLASNPTPLGTLTIAGSPSRSFSEGPAPLLDAGAAEELYFAAVRAAEAANARDWGAMAPTVPLQDAGPLSGATITHYFRGLSIALQLNGNELVGVVLSVDFELGSGGTRWELVVHESVKGGCLYITQFSLHSV